MWEVADVSGRKVAFSPVAEPDFLTGRTWDGPSIRIGVGDLGLSNIFFANNKPLIHHLIPHTESPPFLFYHSVLSVDEKFMGAFGMAKIEAPFMMMSTSTHTRFTEGQVQFTQLLTLLPAPLNISFKTKACGMHIFMFNMAGAKEAIGEVCPHIFQ